MRSEQTAFHTELLTECQNYIMVTQGNTVHMLQILQ